MSKKLGRPTYTHTRASNKPQVGSKDARRTAYEASLTEALRRGDFKYAEEQRAKIAAL